MATTDLIYVLHIDDRLSLREIVSHRKHLDAYRRFPLRGLDTLLARERELTCRTSDGKPRPRSERFRQLLLKRFDVSVMPLCALQWAEHNGWDVGIAEEALFLYGCCPRDVREVRQLSILGTMLHQHGEPPPDSSPILGTVNGESAIHLVRQSLEHSGPADNTFLFARDA